MRGEPVTISNIGKNVKEEMESVKSRMSDGKKTATSVIGRIFEGIGEIFKFLFIAIGKIIAFFFMLIGLIVGFAMFASLFGILGFSFVHYPLFFNHIFGSTAQFGWIWFGVALLIGIPFLMLAFAGARMLFNIKKGTRIVRFSALGLWLIGLGICLTLGINTAKEFSNVDHIRKEIPLAQSSSKILYLKTDESKNHEKNYSGDWSNDNWDEDFEMAEKENKFYSRNVKLDIVKSPNDSFQLVEMLYAHGSSRKAAIENASHITYSFEQADSVMKFNRSFAMEKNPKWRMQKIQLLLCVPVGAVIHFDQSLRNFIYDIDNVQNVYDRDMLNRNWKMTENGLSCLNCTGMESTTDGSDVHINDEDVNEVNINENGVHVVGKNGEQISIDSNGVQIRENGKDIVKIKKKGIHSQPDEKGKK
jgi:hypothetical protein